MVLAEEVKIGTGWTFSPPETHAMVGTVDAALGVMRGRPDMWRKLMHNGMTADLSWNRAAVEYEQVFGNALHNNPTRFW